MIVSNEITLELADKQRKVVLENLVSLYLYELSEFADDLRMNDIGVYEYQGFDLYFNDPDLKAFIAYYNNEIAGFVLLNGGKYVPSNINYSIHELFIINRLRRKNIATAIIKTLMNEYKGRYKNEQIASNTKAVAFWKRFYETERIKYIESEEVIDGFKCYSQVIDPINLNN